MRKPLTRLLESSERFGCTRGALLYTNGQYCAIGSGKVHLLRRQQFRKDAGEAYRHFPTFSSFSRAS
jgi:hypothetical protein